jgi:hypothetical protein
MLAVPRNGVSGVEHVHCPSPAPLAAPHTAVAGQAKQGHGWEDVEQKEGGHGWKDVEQKEGGVHLAVLVMALPLWRRTN